MTSGNYSEEALASNFIVELPSDGKLLFIVCEAKHVIAEDGNWGGLTADEISRFIERKPLRAAALPGRPLRAAEFRMGPGHNPRDD